MTPPSSHSVTSLIYSVPSELGIKCWKVKRKKNNVFFLLRRRKRKHTLLHLMLLQFCCLIRFLELSLLEHHQTASYLLIGKPIVTYLIYVLWIIFGDINNNYTHTVDSCYKLKLNVHCEKSHIINSFNQNLISAVSTIDKLFVS